MSLPDSETTHASIRYNGKIYRMFSNALGGEIKQRFENYMSQKGYFTSAPWSHIDYLWEIRENKLFLKKILINFSLKGCKWQDITKKISNQDEIFANWANQELKLLISKKPFYFPKRKREILYLKIKNGILTNSYKKEEIYTFNGLKHYFFLELFSHIGVFWIYDNKLYKKTQIINEGIKKDNFTYPSFGLDKAWKEIRCKESTLYYFNYNELSNGTIAFDNKHGKFIVFTTKEVMDNEVYKHLITSNFNLEDKFVEFRLI